ncbi:MAG: SWIM zinc finger protein [Candidatus Methanohalarchaeum thermophilum]|uniref:SWIM zinc finger protein n=1 Tax=Methanohalarchaeum thermophilum TaxID=1903181 RepID=A0A1Q6DTN5_METT1|nr:MAG: SWIM zinc finger protein [Candidatus Methanohalarchaeum thermophilum]
MEDIFLSIRNEDKFNEEAKKLILEKFGKRGERAINGLEEDKIKKYNDFWIVIGEKDHIVINKCFCDCEDYLYNISSREGSEKYCWHSIAVKLADIFNMYSKINEFYFKYMNLH